MTRYFLIFLLLISFNANAIAGSVMMLSMSPMTSDMTGKSEMTSHPMTNGEHQMSMSDMSMNHCQSQLSTDSNCEDSHDCGLCMMHCSAALISEITAINSPPLFSFEPNYHVQDALSTHSHLLRPPKFA